jgi:hypothetical protein
MDSSGANQLHLHFNRSLLGSNWAFKVHYTLYAIHYPLCTNLTSKAKPSRKHPDAKVFKTDSAGAMVCTVLPPNPTDPGALRGNETTCACSSWGSLYFKGAEGEGEGASSVDYCEVGPGWKPTAAMLKAGKPKYFENNLFDSQWTAVPLAQANLSSSAVSTYTQLKSTLDGAQLAI